MSETAEEYVMLPDNAKSALDDASNTEELRE